MRYFLQQLIKFGTIGLILTSSVAFWPGVLGGYLAYKAVDVFAGLINVIHNRRMSAKANISDEEKQRLIRVHKENTNKQFFNVRENRWNLRDLPFDFFPSEKISGRETYFTVAGVENVVKGRVLDNRGRKVAFSIEFDSADKAQKMSEYIADDDENGGLSVQMIDDVYPHLFDWLSLLDMNVLIVLALMFIVAGFNMISGLLIILFQNISTIGLLKSLGMTTSGVCRIFLCKAGLIVLKGMVIGNLIAISLLEIQERFQMLELSQENYFTDHVPVCIDPAKTISMNIIAFAVMMLIMMIPSGFISRISPANTVKAE